MAKLPKPHSDSPIEINHRPVPFAFWPVFKNNRRYGVQATLFALDPWNIIADNIRKKCPVTSRPEAEASLEQAQDFYNASLTSHLASARPLLLYYSFLNLVKAFGLLSGVSATFDQAMHGVTEQLPTGGTELVDAYLRAFPSPNGGKRQIFDDFVKSLGGLGLSAGSFDYKLADLIPQIVSGHRLWCRAVDKNERFIALDKIEVRDDRLNKELRVNIYLYADDIRRCGLSHEKLLEYSRLAANFRQVKFESGKARKIIRLEQINPERYTGRAGDSLQRVCDRMKGKIWSMVSQGEPYRRYYLYMIESTGHAQVVPQLASIYSVIYYLGSITRYRPHQFDSILDGPYGAWVKEFLIGQPIQFIYLLASEFAKQEVTRPAIV